MPPMRRMKKYSRVEIKRNGKKNIQKNCVSMLWPGELPQEILAAVSFSLSSLLVPSELSLMDWKIRFFGADGLPSTIFETVISPRTVSLST